jgi:hypothetical protein
MSPTLSVPVWTSTEATEPRPFSSFASITAPRAVRFGSAFSSSSSACSRIASSRSSSPMRFSAETSSTWTSPPMSSGTSSCSSSWVFARFGSAPSLSILLIATMIGTSAALAWLIASIVCGCSPSSAATTRITRSVTWAPRLRMAVKAS